MTTTATKRDILDHVANEGHYSEFLINLLNGCFPTDYVPGGKRGMLKLHEFCEKHNLSYCEEIVTDLGGRRQLLITFTRRKEGASVRIS